MSKPVSRCIGTCSRSRPIAKRRGAVSCWVISAPARNTAGLFAALQSFARRHLRSFGTPFSSATRRLDPTRRLRIGWLSPRFASGPVAVFFTGLLAAFDRSRHRHLLIALRPERDAATERLRSLADEWFDFSTL